MLGSAGRSDPRPLPTANARRRPRDRSGRSNGAPPRRRPDRPRSHARALFGSRNGVLAAKPSRPRARSPNRHRPRGPDAARPSNPPRRRHRARRRAGSRAKPVARYPESGCGVRRTSGGSLPRRGARIDDRGYLRNAVCRESALAGVLTDTLLIGGFVKTIHAIAGYVTMDPFDVGAHPVQDAARFLCDRLQFVLGKVSRSRDVALDDVSLQCHGLAPCSALARNYDGVAESLTRTFEGRVEGS